MADVKNETLRDAYEAPTIEDIPLRAEERILQNCKNFTPGAGFGSQGGPQGTCFSTTCQGFSPS